MKRRELLHATAAFRLDRSDAIDRFRGAPCPAQASCERRRSGRLSRFRRRGDHRLLRTVGSLSRRAGRRRARTSPCRSAPALSCSRAAVCSRGGVLISAIFVQGALGKINACRRRENRRLREDLIPSERRSLRFGCWKETSCELAGYRRSCRCSAYESRHTTCRRSRSRIRHRSGEPHDIRRRASILRRDTRLADSLHGSVPSHNRSDTGLDTSRSDVAPRLRSKDRRPSPTARALRTTTNPSPHNRRIDMGNRPHTCLHRHIAGHRASKPSHIGSYKPIGRSVAVEATRVPAPLCRPRRRLAGRLPDRRPTPAHARAGLQEAPAAACRALRPKGAPPRRPAHQAGAAADPRTAQTRSRGTATARGSGRGASA